LPAHQVDMGEEPTVIDAGPGVPCGKDGGENWRLSRLWPALPGIYSPSGREGWGNT